MGATTPANPLAKARERAWVAASGDLMMFMYSAVMSSDEGEIKEATADLWGTLAKVEEHLSGGEFFTEKFSLVDAAFAPFFMRLLMFKSLRESPHWKKLPKTRCWADSLLKLPEVRDSVIPEFKERYVSYLTKNGSPSVSELS